MSQDNSIKKIQILQSALTWLDRGAELIPVKADSKHIVKGYGPRRKRIKNRSEARRFFDNSNLYNLSVLLPAGLVCLDFDDDALFFKWSDALPVELASTYHETTARGFHVFYRCDIPRGVKLVDGVEIKRAVMVAPSRVAGAEYTPVEPYHEIVTISDWKTLLFSLLSEKDTECEPVEPVAPGPDPVVNGDDVIAKIKRRWSLLEVASRLTELQPSPPGQDRWYLGRCPLHDDENPSFWVDAERQVWNCFSPHCPGHTGEGGHDVINLLALRKNISLTEAIRRLARGVSE